MHFPNYTSLDFIIGLEKAKPLVRLFAEAFVKFQNREYVEGLELIFKSLMEKDTQSIELFEKLQQEAHAQKSSMRYIVRIALLVLDSEVGHSLITILTGIDPRAIYIAANVLCEDFPKIIFKLSDISDLEQGYIGLLLNEELLLLKKTYEKYFI